MRWNVSEYNNVKDIRVPPNNLWKPDILMYNRYTFLNLILLAWYRVGGINVLMMLTRDLSTIQCQWSFRLHLPDQRGGDQRWYLHLHPTRSGRNWYDSEGLNLSSPQGSLCLPVPWTSLGSPLMIKIARWNLAAGLTMDLRSIKCRAYHSLVAAGSEDSKL